MKIFALVFTWCLGAGIVMAQKTYLRTYGSKSYDHGRAVKQLDDGGFIISGASASRGAGNTDAYLLRVDAEGTLNWTNTYGTDAIEWALDLLVLNDGYLLIGYSNQAENKGYDGYVVKTDKQGKVIWEKVYGGSNWDFLYKGLATSDGGYVLVGETYSYGNGDADLYALKLDPAGVVIWEKTFGEAQKDYAVSVLENDSNEYLLLGNITNNNYKKEIVVIKVDNMGEELHRYEYKDSLENEAVSIIKLAQGGYAIAGTTNNTNKKELFTMVANENLNTIWQKRDPKVGDKDDIARGIAQSVSGDDLIIFGTMESYGAGMGDFGFYIRNNRGVYLESGTFGQEKLEDGYDIIPCKEGGYVMVGTTESYEAKYSSILLIKVDSVGEYNKDDEKHFEDVTAVNKHEFMQLASIYPNPFKDETVVDLSGYRGNFPLTFTIYAVDGRKIYEFSSFSVQNKIPASKLGLGMFLLKVNDSKNEFVYSGRLITH